MTGEQLITVTSGSLLVGVLVTGIALRGGIGGVWRTRWLLALVILGVVAWALLRPILTRAYGDLAVSVVAALVALGVIAWLVQRWWPTRPPGR